MVKKLESILLATNLKEYNKISFDVAASLCTHYGAKLILLHVLEKVPGQVEATLTGLMGESEREAVIKASAEKVKQKMVGKDISSTIIRSSLEEYCENSGIDPKTGGFPSREVIVCEGDIVESIISTSEEHNCGMIVLAAHEGLFSKSAISATIKNVLKQSTVPVLTVPNVFQ